MPDCWIVRTADRLLRVFLLAYPPAFRRAFGDDMMEVHRDRCREEWRRGRWWGLTTYWVSTALDLIEDGLAERFASRRTPKRQRRREIMSTIVQDLHYAIRSLKRQPAFTAVVILTLALGIGANAAIFSVVDGILLRSLPYHEPDRLVRIWGADQTGEERFLEVAYQDFEAFRDDSRSFSGIGAFSEAPHDLVDAFGNPTEVRVARVTAGLFATLGVQPALGRPFLPDDARRQIRVLILSHALWQSRYGADAAVLGRTITIRGRGFEIVGVMPPGFRYPDSADLWLPLVPQDQDDDREFHVIGRLAPGRTVAQASSDVERIAARLAETTPATNEDLTAWVQPMHDMLVREVRTPLLVLLGAVGFVLLIVCANVANLLLARGASREHELAIRTAIGASRGRILRQLLTESVLLAGIGGAVGILLGLWTLQGIVAISPENTPRLAEVALDMRVLGVMAGVTILTGFALGLVPGIVASRPEVLTAVRGQGPGNTARQERHRLQRGLIVAEIALATVLVIGAGLLITSFNRLLEWDRGFVTENVLLVPIHPGGRFESRGHVIAFFEEILERVGALPGVRSAALSATDPMRARGIRAAIDVGPEPAPDPDDLPVVAWHVATPDYFRTLGIPLLAGRGLGDGDNETSPRVVVINEAFAAAFFPDTDPVGRRLRDPAFEIVGVVRNVSPQIESVPRPVMTSPFRQAAFPGMTLIVRAAGDPLVLAPRIREHVWAMDPTIPLDNIATIEQRIAGSVASPRFNMLLVGSFGALALLLAAVGVHGVMSYTVGQRAKELGLRRALGAGKNEILTMIMRQGLALAGMGVAMGLLAAVWVTRLLESLLYDVAPSDPLNFAGVAGVLVVVAAAACYLPARRAARVDPMTTLRNG
ncbi:MAG: ABC transporter permease [Gemmatimonadetes bacterium]|nr:ABC transporter permease [Gemmatimonadota bacterium]